jgi:hydrogenase-4 component E
MIADIAVVLFGVTLLYVSTAGMIESYIKMLTVQGLLLFVIAIFSLTEYNVGGIIFAAAETLLLKAIIIPLFLRKTVRENNVVREIEPYITNFHSILIETLILGAGFAAAYFAATAGGGVKPFAFGIAVSSVLTGLFIIISRKKLLTHVMGYMVIENGIFLMSLAVAAELPVLVSLGVSMDILIGVLLAGIFINRIRSAFENQDIDQLTRLKD